MRTLKMRKTSASGFTLLELMISVALMIVVSGAILGAMSQYQKTYRGTELKVSVDQQMRSALELMSQEIGQAGLPLSRLAGSRTDSTDNALVVAQAVGNLGKDTVVGDTSSVPITINSTEFPFYAGQKVIIDTNGSREEVAINTVNSTAKTVTFGDYTDPLNPQLLKYVHTTGNPIFSGGLYPEGVLWWDDGTYSATTRSDTFTGYELWVFGDITNRGKLDLISYKCDQTTKQLIRTAYDVDTKSCPAAAPSKPQNTANAQQVVLLDNVTNCDPAAKMPPFTVVPWFGSGDTAGTHAASTGNTTPYTFITSVSITLQTQSLTNDTQTKKPIILTKSLLNIQPRNILSGYRRALNDPNLLDPSKVVGDTSDLQPNPQYGAFACFYKD